jgi:Tat protein translocase TatB subunit
MLGPIGGSEIILILGLALLIFGPRKLPEIGKSIGRTVAQLRRAATDFKLDLEREVRVDEIRKTGQALGDVGHDIDNAVRGTTPRAPEKPQPAPERATPPASAAPPSPTTGAGPVDAGGSDADRE